jgi:hypothetical protein
MANHRFTLGRSRGQRSAWARGRTKCSSDAEKYPLRLTQLFLSAFRFEDITYSAAGNSFAFHGIAPEDDFGVQLVVNGVAAMI